MATKRPPFTHPTVEISQAHWDALADAIGTDEASWLYGPRPELVNTADSVRRLYTVAGRSVIPTPLLATVAVLVMALTLACSVAYRATHKVDRPAVELEPCALVQTRDGEVCR